MTEIIEVELDPQIEADRAEYAATAHERAVAECEVLRQSAYQAESDPLFFKYQRSEDGVTKAAWLAKVEEIRERYPMPEEAVK